MRLMYEYWREFVLSFLVACFFTIGLYWYIAEPESSSVKALLVLLITADLLFIIYIIKSLWKAKWREFAVIASQRFFEKFSNSLMRLFEKFNFISKSNTQNMIFGTSSVSFDRYYEDPPMRSRKRVPKWKTLDDDRKRLGLLYRYMIINKVKGGMPARAADIPLELKTREENTSPENELFDIYINTRYDERKTPPKSKIDILKNTFEHEWRIK